MFRVFAAAFAAALAGSLAVASAAADPSSGAPPITAASIKDAASNGVNDNDPSLIATDWCAGDSGLPSPRDSQFLAKREASAPASPISWSGKRNFAG